MKRGKYKLKKRAERQEETRLRIARATLELHETVGPALTTRSAIAERAGVGRPPSTVTSLTTYPWVRLARR
jgi:hypothetical protein